jgi:small-conductance mechanosensitive channel
MTVDINEAKVKRNEFSLWLSWTLATALGMLAGYLSVAPFVSSLDLGIARVIVPIVSGIFLGLAQWLVLRPYISKSYDWILNHAVGWVVGYTLGLFVVQLLSKTPLGMLIGFISFGVIVALFQYPALRREIPHLATWILANVIGWTLGAYLSLLAAGVFFQNQVPTTFTSVLVSVGITGLVAGAITGLALIWIVRQPDRLVASS